jgi:hypothetical protein
MSIEERSNEANSGGMRQLVKGVLPLAIVCLFLWGLIKQPSPKWGFHCRSGESVSLFREPDAGNLLVRFDERERETEPSHTGLR